MNKTILHGKWRQARGGLKTRWAELTDDDRRMLNGKIDQMIGLFEERYGYTRQRASNAVAHYLTGHANRKRRRAVASTRLGPMAIGAVGLFSLIVVGRYALKRFMSNRKTAMQETTPEPFISPEMRLDEVEFDEMGFGDIEFA